MGFIQCQNNCQWKRCSGAPTGGGDIIATPFKRHLWVKRLLLSLWMVSKDRSDVFGERWSTMLISPFKWRLAVFYDFRSLIGPANGLIGSVSAQNHTSLLTDNVTYCSLHLCVFSSHGSVSTTVNDVAVKEEIALCPCLTERQWKRAVFDGRWRMTSERRLKC